MGAAEFAEKIETECISPGEKRRLHFENRFAPVTEENVIGRLVLEAIRAPQFTRLAVRTKKKMRHIEHVRAQIGENAEIFVAPG